MCRGSSQFGLRCSPLPLELGTQGMRAHACGLGVKPPAPAALVRGPKCDLSFVISGTALPRAMATPLTTKGTLGMAHPLWFWFACLGVRMDKLEPHL